MNLKWLTILVGFVMIPAFGQATQMATIMSNYANYNIPLIADNTIEINSITALSGVEGNVNLTPTSRPLVLILVEPRLMNSFTGTKYQLTDLQDRLKRFKRDLVNDGKFGLVLSTSVYDGAVHQDGLTAMALRRFFIDVKANYTLEGVIFVGRFPECSELRRLNWGYGWGQVRDLTTNTVVQDFSGDGAILCVNTGIEAPRTDIPMADLDGNWESLYRATVTPEWCFVKPNNNLNLDQSSAVWQQQTFTITGTKYAFQAGINPTYTDVFYVDDADYTAPTINNGTISLTVTTTPPSPEASATDRTRTSPQAMPDILISHINPYGVAIQEDPAWQDINGQSVYDAQGKPQTVASAPPAPTISQDLERILLVEYFDNNHYFRSGYYYNQPFNYGSAAHNLGGAAANTSAGLTSARTDWWQQNNAIETPAVGSGATQIHALADWLGQNVPFRFIMAHAGPTANQFGVSTASQMVSSIGNPYIWTQSNNLWVPSWGNHSNACYNFYRALWGNKTISASISPSLALNGGCEAATPVGDNGGATNSYINYGQRQVSECLMFYGKTVGTLSRARIYFDQLEGWQNYTRGNPSAMFGEIWFKNYESISATQNAWFPDRAGSKRTYWWNIFGDYTLRLRYSPCDGAQGGGDGYQGTAFGLSPSYAAGSEYCMATDGDVNTFFDYSQANGAYTGLDFGTNPPVIGKIRYYPRAGWASRMDGGTFQGSNTSSTSGYVDLYTIYGTPADQWNEIVISNSTAYRWIRYLAPDGGYGNIAEMEFYDPQYYIVAMSGPNGSISPSGAIWVKSGESQTFTITPNTGYAVKDVKVDNVSQGEITTYTFSNVTAEHSISATFKPIQHTITALSESEGSISPSGSVLVNNGASQTFTITPNTGYRIDEVLVDGANAGSVSSYTFDNVTGDHTITATFVIQQFTITSSAGANGTISPNGAWLINYGGAQTFTITPNSGYTVNAVTVDGTNMGAVTSYPFTNVTADHSISVTFVPMNPKYEAEKATLSGGAKVNTNHAGYGGTGFVDGFYNSTTAQTAFNVYVQSAGMYYVKLHYSAGNGTSTNTGLYVNGTKLKNISCTGTYNWDAWSDQTETVALNAGFNTVAYKAETSSGKCINLDYIIVDYAGSAGYTITASAGTGGSISPSGSVNVNSGASQTFTITPAANYSISAVTVDGSNKGAVTTYTFTNVTANHTISATFAPSQKIEAENATLSNGAIKATDHSGYSGTGFVAGYYYSTTAQTAFTVNVPSAGTYTLKLRYSAGNGASSNTGLYVNGTKIKNISCPTTSNWNTWADKTETVTLIAGNNTIAYKAVTSSNACINLDYLTVSK